MTSPYELACQKMKKKPQNPIGTCFDSVGRNIIYNHDMPADAYICHAIGISNMPGEEGELMAHAWIEFENKFHGMVAVDTTWDEAVLASRYREILKIRKVVTYTQKEFMKLWREFNYPGPWDYDILQVIKSYSKKERVYVTRN